MYCVKNYVKLNKEGLSAPTAFKADLFSFQVLLLTASVRILRCFLYLKWHNICFDDGVAIQVPFNLIIAIVARLIFSCSTLRLALAAASSQSLELLSLRRSSWSASNLLLHRPLMYRDLLQYIKENNEQACVAGIVISWDTYKLDP